MTVNGGVKNWISGQVLDAADLNAYVANQVIARFETIAARTAAYGIANAPSLQKGLFSWVDSTEKLYYYDGSAWEEVGAQVEDLQITTAKIADSAVTSAKLADATIKIETGNYTLQLTDKNKFIKMNIALTANTVTIPLDSTVNFPEGAQIHIIQYGTGKTQVVGATGAVIIYSTPGSFLRAQYSSATLLKCATANTWMLMGDLSAS